MLGTINSHCATRADTHCVYDHYPSDRIPVNSVTALGVDIAEYIPCVSLPPVSSLDNNGLGSVSDAHFDLDRSKLGQTLTDNDGIYLAYLVKLAGQKTHM
jgi:hypothetical protein